MIHRAVALSLLSFLALSVVEGFHTLYPNRPHHRVHNGHGLYRSGSTAASLDRPFPTTTENAALFSVSKTGDQSMSYVTQTTSASSASNTTSALPMVSAVNGAAAAVVVQDLPTVPFPIVLWRFTRPHTIIGSALAIPALHVLAAPSLAAAFTMKTAASIAYTMLPALLMNLYITGLNQVTDVEIDKINKPDLPIAAGILSPRRAVICCLVALVSSLWLGVAHPQFSTQGLNVALWGSGLLGTLYSLEPFRLKRFPVLAAVCIVAVRGTLINASFFAHAQAAAFGVPSATVWNCLLTNARCLCSSLFFCVFGLVIALMKDVPDVLGDQVSNVRTFSVRVGPVRIFRTGRRLLTGLFGVTAAGFVAGAATAATLPLAAGRTVTAVCALAAAVSVRRQSAAVDPERPNQVYKYYMHLWKIFYLSYLVLPFAR